MVMSHREAMWMIGARVVVVVVIAAAVVEAVLSH